MVTTYGENAAEVIIWKEREREKRKMYKSAENKMGAGLCLKNYTNQNTVEPRFNVLWFDEYFFYPDKKDAKMLRFNEFLALI